MLDLRSGGWVLLLALVLSLIVVAWRVVPVLRSNRTGVANGAYHGFRLDPCLVDRDLVVSGGFPKDGLPALVEPATITPEQADALDARERGKYLVPSDRVIGVRLGAAARAYPLRVLNWHEVANDVLDGLPIAVTYSPLCDSVAVFSRRAGDEVLEFGVSGLLFNSNLLLYDRRDDDVEESLWSQLQGRAVAGPAAAARARLRPLPGSVTTWQRWRRAHPETTVLEPDRAMLDRYRRNPYGSYYSTGRPRFPVSPLPEPGRRALMSRVVAVQGSGEQPPRVFLLGEAGSSGSHELPGGGEIVIDDAVTPPSVLVRATNGREAPGVFHAFWFAWYASRGG